MATTPNMKFWHVTVMDSIEDNTSIYGKKPVPIFFKKCLSVQEANTLLDEKRKEYPINTPGHEYSVFKENY
jgi:hypothetical protein